MTDKAGKVVGIAAQLRNANTTLLDKIAIEAMKLIMAEHLRGENKEINPFNVGMLSYATALGMMAAREQPEEVFVQKQEPAPSETPSSLIVPPVS